MKQNNRKILICILAALFTVLAFTTSNQLITNESALQVIHTDNSVIISIVKFGLNYQKAYGVNSSILLFLLAYFYNQMNRKMEQQDKRLNRVAFCRWTNFCYFYAIWK